MGDVYVTQYAASGCAELSGAAFRVLMRMALAVRDEDSKPGADDAGLYFGGWKGLTVCLGYGVVMDNEPIPSKAERAITRAVRELRDAGYIDVAPKRMQGAHWNRVYRLSIRPVLGALNTPPRV